MRASRLIPALLVLAVLASACGSSGPSSQLATPATESTNSSSLAPDPSTTVATNPASTTPAGEQSDVVLQNAKVITVDGDFTIAEAVAITDGNIVAVGPSSDVSAMIGPDTLVVDLGGRTLLPGFIDPHTHSLQTLAYIPDLEAMLSAQNDLLSGGVTTIGSPAVSPDDLAGFEAFDSSGDVIVRDHLYLTYNRVCGEQVDGDFYLSQDFSHDPELRQTVAGAKIFTDGGACNAPAFSIPYLDSTPQRLKDRGFTATGDLYISADEVASVVSRVDAAGGITLIHAIGDLGNRVALDGLQQAFDQQPFENPQRIDHNSATTLLSAEELARYGGLGMVPAIFPVPFADGCDPATVELWQSILAPKLFDIIESSQALREANPDLRISWHGDAPSVPGHPLQLIYTLVTGGAVDIDTGGVCRPDWGDRFTVSAEEALRMITINAAAAMGIDERVGSIEVGKVADLVVLANDPLDNDPDVGFATNYPLATMIDGHTQFCEPELCDLLGGPTPTGEPNTNEGSVGSKSVDGVNVTASAFRDVHTPELVLDGLSEGDGFWSSGQDAPGWIELAFDEPRTVTALRLTVFQNPPGDTVHNVEIQVDGKWNDATSFQGFTSTGDVLEWRPDTPAADVEAVRITTVESPSWPEWYEIAVDTDAQPTAK